MTRSRRALALVVAAALALAGAAAAWSVTRPGASAGPTTAQLAAAFPDLEPGRPRRG